MDTVELIGCDSFEGFPEPHGKDARLDGTVHTRARRGALSAPVEVVAAKVRALGYERQIRLVKGFFEETLPLLGDRFSLVHLDVDLYASYRTCLEFFYPRLLRGAYMVFDEYGESDVYPGAKRAIDEFLADKPEGIARFPEARSPRYFIQKV
jgi:O-methyltransferase